MTASVLRTIAAALLTTLLSVAMSEPTSAAHQPAQLGLTPVGQSGSYFDLTLLPGESRELQVELGNFGDEAVDARTYASDVYTIVNGGFGTELFGEAPSGITLWLDYASREVTLAPGAAVTIDFVISVPPDTPPGEYITGLVAENASPFAGSAQDGVAIHQVNRTAIAVAIEVPGPRRPALEIGGVTHAISAGTSVVAFHLSNSGNVHLVPAGDFTLRNHEGSALADSAVRLDTVYAGTSAIVEVPLSAPLSVGDYCAELSLTDPKAGADAATDCLPFTVTSPIEPDGASSEPGIGPIVGGTVDAVAANGLLITLIALAVLLSVAFVVFVRRRRRRDYIDARTAPVARPTGDPVGETRRHLR